MQLMAQSRVANIWASVQFNKESVVVGEPLLITITVYTSTWFTSPPHFSEIQVPEAMMVDYQQRTGSVRKSIGNKTYPAIEKKYLVYPFSPGENRLPSLTIVVESPPEGDYKGRKRTIKSPERTFTVLPPPEGVHLDNWMTAYNVSLSEIWDRPLDQLKQGDVPERQITIRANGALAALIPPLELISGSFGSVYSRPASLSNVQNQSSFTGTRIENWTYLMESEGKHSIPGIELSWYNPGSGQLEHARIEEREIIVSENPNMDYLLSMQDSLQSMLEAGEVLEEREAFEWMGLNWWQLTVVMLILMLITVLFLRLVRRIAILSKEKKIASRDAEQWYFEKLIKAGSENPDIFMRALFSWYDRFRKERYGPDLESFVCANASVGLGAGLRQLEGIVYGDVDPEAWNGNELIEQLRTARDISNNVHASRHMDILKPMNPVDEDVVQCVKRE